MRFAILLSLAALLLVCAMSVLMQPLRTAGPMNFSFEEPIGTTLIALGVLALVGAAWKSTAGLWTWAVSMILLGSLLLAIIRYSVAHHPPREGRADPSGLVPPTDYSMFLAYTTGVALVAIGIGVPFLAVRLKTNKANKYPTA